MANNIYDFKVEDTKGKLVALSFYTGKVLLIVNTARKCGLAEQFTQLEALYNKYKDQGLIVLAFPCNQFLNQEPATNEEMVDSCQLEFGVTFPLFAKVNVNGGDTHPLYRFLKSEAKGFLGTQAIKWNFTKFLIDKQGRVRSRYAPNNTPMEMEKDIIALLQ